MEERKGFLRQFREFMMQGNVVQLAVAIIIGIAFGAVVSAFVNGVVMALIAAIFGKPSFDALLVHVGKGNILYGTFLTALVNFVIVGSVLFAIVKTMQRFEKPKEIDLTEPKPTQEALSLTEIRDLLQRQRVI